MSDRLMGALASLILLLVYLGPLVGLLFLVRWLQNRGKRRVLAQGARAAAAPLQSPAAQEAETPPPQPAGYRIDMSGVYGSWALFGIAAAIVLLAVGRWWGYIGHGLYLLLLGLVYWTAFSRSAYQSEHQKCESLDRRGYAQVTLLFFAALPTAVWLIVMLPLLLRQLGVAGRP